MMTGCVVLLCVPDILETGLFITSLIIITLLLLVYI